MAARPRAKSRSELALEASALRQDWPIPPAVKAELLGVAVGIALGTPPPAPPTGPEAAPGGDPGGDADPPPDPDRTRLAALRVLAMFGRLSLGQQHLDLAREKFAGPAQPPGAAKPRLLIPSSDDRYGPDPPP